MAKIKVYLENGVVFVTTTAVDLSSTFTAARPPAVNSYSANGFLTASVVSSTKVKVIASGNQNEILFTEQNAADIVQKDGSTVHGANASATVTALNALFDAPAIENFVVKDPNSNNSGTTKIRHKADASGTADRDQAGTLELDTHSASIGLYESFLKINEIDLSNTGGKTQALGQFTLDLQRLTGGSTNVMTIRMQQLVQGAQGDFNFQSLDISGDVTFSTGTGTVTFSGDTSGIDYADLSNKPTLYADASVDTHLNQSSASSGQYLKWNGSDYAWGTISSGGLGNVVEDTTPQLGGDLDVNGNKIISASNGDIVIDPNGTGAILLKSDNIKFEGAGTVTMSSLKFYEATALDGNYVALKAPLSISSDVTWELPGADGTANQVIKTNGSGVLSFATVVSATNPVMQGTASFKAVASLPGAVKIFDVDDSHGVRLLAPSMTADLDLTLPATDGSSGQVLQTDGSGNLSFVAQTADTNTNLGNTDMTLSGSRIITMSNDLNFKVGSTSKLLYDVSANSGNGKWTFNAVTQFLNDVEFHGAGGTTQASIKFNEPSQGGANGVVLQGPATNMTSDLTFTLPDTDGSAGQFLKTDGSGNLAFAAASGGGGMTETPFVSMSGRATFGSSDEEERVLIGTSYGWSFYSQSQEMGDWSSSQTIDSTTHGLAAYLRGQAALIMPSDAKKVRVKVSYRVQNGNNTDFGFSLWSGPIDNSSTATSNVTLRGQCVTQTVGSSSITAYKKEFTTTSSITDDAVFMVVEQRGGGPGLASTCYVYYSIHLFLVD